MKNDNYNLLLLIAVLSISIIIYIFPPVPSEIEYSDVLLFFRVFLLYSFS